MIEMMHTRQARLSMHWYFVRSQEIAGGVGLLKFEYRAEPAGRLQDVDIFSAYQSRRLGNVLWKAVEALAYRKNLTNLYLGDDTNDWPLY
ncbi:MAG: hypothetical protein GFH27_549321n104 [Chloroflexi bacterium AL-W]|nr:hypothetical protein [Chloroflexi bacterium AL-N1]NOK64982.1 hypothetical protein [Chloroflexi bacterium AL-N10]NOK76752.1 hypothetical protein [Chloroflexi bacterium AL-N5]NOK84643.1 hypothetical protein [Chloroflexi bacterium AL-W]NOK86532.1 hypothetical protein [Chloroflexi bacterium AL-N15]